MNMQRRRKRHIKGKSAGLNLVSLMDIFTILVFFLMVNSSEVEVLQTSSKIKLSDSSSDKQPKNQLMISVSSEDLIVQGRPVASIAELEGQNDPMIAGLKTELEYQRDRKGEVPEGGLEITVMGDRELPYWLLKRILLTCQTTDFAKVSLAVNQLTNADDAEALLTTEAIVPTEAPGAAS